MIASCGGGSNLGGISLPFVPDDGVRVMAVEPSSCATLTSGRFDYDFGDVAGMTPLLPMYTLGHDFIPPPIHAGGLRYHGDAPIISNLVQAGRMEAVAYPQGKVFEAAVQFARTQGSVPAPETSHAHAPTGNLRIRTSRSVYFNDTWTAPPGDVNLMAFESKFNMTCWSRVASAISMMSDSSRSFSIAK